jgi:hypothetical protein
MPPIRVTVNKQETPARQDVSLIAMLPPPGVAAIVPIPSPSAIVPVVVPVRLTTKNSIGSPPGLAQVVIAMLVVLLPPTLTDPLATER